jgi:hypothetical protein
MKIRLNFVEIFFLTFIISSYFIFSNNNLFAITYKNETLESLIVASYLTVILDNTKVTGDIIFCTKRKGSVILRNASSVKGAIVNGSIRGY